MLKNGNAKQNNLEIGNDANIKMQKCNNTTPKKPLIKKTKMNYTNAIFKVVWFRPGHEWLTITRAHAHIGHV